jgi:hypothetical protein
MSKFIDRLAKAVYDRVYPERGNWAAIGGIDRENFRDVVDFHLSTPPWYVRRWLRSEVRRIARVYSEAHAAILAKDAIDPQRRK